MGLRQLFCRVEGVQPALVAGRALGQRCRIGVAVVRAGVAFSEIDTLVPLGAAGKRGRWLLLGFNAIYT